MSDVDPETLKRIKRLKKMLNVVSEVTYSGDKIANIAYEVDKTLAEHFISHHNKEPEEILSHCLNIIFPKSKDKRRQFMKEATLYADEKGIPDELFIRSIFFAGLLHMLLGLAINYHELPASLRKKFDTVSYHS